MSSAFVGVVVGVEFDVPPVPPTPVGRGAVGAVGPSPPVPKGLTLGPIVGVSGTNRPTLGTVGPIPGATCCATADACADSGCKTCGNKCCQHARRAIERMSLFMNAIAGHCDLREFSLLKRPQNLIDYCAGATKLTIFSCSTFFIRFVTSSFVIRFSPN